MELTTPPEPPNSNDRANHVMAHSPQRCNKEMCCKFGKIVDIEVLEGVTADPHLEDIRARLVRSQLSSDTEIRKLKKAESYMHELNVNSVR